ncbi:MAG: MerR family transcriptional regulator [Devosia sp.]|nr:MerR family transcriptional regulator [Devosia sp.]OJX50361.1 MAG: MerR family transcriptional regulator [Devosia sp. 66-22]
MKMLTVKQVAKISGVSVRALHHYDEIGLLKPASTGRNGYRYYGRDELLRLQQILLHRELDIPLGDIRAILDDPRFDQLEALRLQRDKLAAEAKRYAQLVRTIDRTIADLNGESAMRNAELYKGISAEKQAEYEAWLVKKYGGDMPRHIETSKRKYESLSQAEKDQLNTDLKELETAWADAMRNGVPADSTALDPLLGRFRDWVSAMWNRPCPPDAFAGLADLHLSHPDFVSRYEALGEGFSEYHAEAMKAYARRLAA